jgi:hypothetical protein
MDGWNIIDSKKWKYCTWNNNKYCFKYLALFCITQPSFEILINNSSKKNILFNLVIAPFKALRAHEWTTISLSMDRKDKVGKYTFVRSVVFVL